MAGVGQYRSVLGDYRVHDGTYLLGSLETGVTVWKQQVRAHNLIWALWEASGRSDSRPLKIAIVGGGIGGLTAAACILSRMPGAEITIFERRWDLCPLQQGSDNRWLHPHIYGWPALGSRAPEASLPVLNWVEGRASDVARTILFQFAKYRKVYDTNANAPRVRIFLGVHHLRIDHKQRKIEWIGSRAIGATSYVDLGGTEGSSEHFDVIILAPGFGLEIGCSDSETPLYWRNEQYGQPILDGGQPLYVVSGYRDGALVDLCRLRIEGFRQDTIVYELFSANDLEAAEELLRAAKVHELPNILDLLQKSQSKAFVSRAWLSLAHRLRSDTRVVLHVAGRGPVDASFRKLFSQGSSVLNRFLLFLLYRCGAFELNFAPLDEVIETYRSSAEAIICRHGPQPLEHVLQIFISPSSVKQRLQKMHAQQNQAARPLWFPGTFTHLP